MTRMLCNVPDLYAELAALVEQIPAGRVSTCGALALALGDRHAATWIGFHLLHHEHLPGCKCHRVVRARGVLGGFGGGSPVVKGRLLRAEGVAIRAGLVDLDRFEFDAFRSSHPLVALRDEQLALRHGAQREAWTALPRRIGGLDVSYAAQGIAVAAYTVVDTKSGALVWSTTVSCPARFPYIPTYLTYRELPALSLAVAAARQAGELAPLTLVDGTGILHPRRLGVAAHFGVVADIATVGVAKSLLCGRLLERPRQTAPVPVFDGDELLGAAIRPTANPKQTLYVSPGHRVDVATAERAVIAMLRGRRLPEPIYWADRLSRSAAREKVVPYR